MVLQLAIVVKNEKNGLKTTLKSIIESFSGCDTSNFEILIVDGYSKDGSWEVAKEFQFKNTDIKINIIQAEPKGVYNAMNIAVKLTSCKWIWFVNSGDVLISPLSKINTILENQKNRFNAISGKCGLFFTPKASSVFFEKKKNTQTRPHQSTLYKVSLHGLYGLYREDKIGSSDTIFLSRIVSNEVLMIDENFSATLVSPQNISRNPRTILNDTNNLSLKISIKICIYYLEKIIRFSFSTFIKQIFLLIIGKVELRVIKK